MFGCQVKFGIVAVFLVCGFAVPAVNLRDLPDDLFTRRVEISFAPVGDGVHTNFPALVRISESRLPGFAYQQCDWRGRDVRFFDGDGKSVPFEIDTWNDGGESKIWVRVAEFSSASRLTMCWGGAAPKIDSYVKNVAAAVWTHYVGVWHFNDFGNSGTNVLPLAEKLSPVRSADNTLLGANYDFAKTNGLWVANPVASNLLSDVSKFTVSLWAKPRSTSGVARIVGNKPKDGGSWAGFDVFWNSNSEINMRGTRNVSKITYAQQREQDRWYHLGFRYNGASGGIFVDGISKTKSGNIEAVTDQNRKMGIGNTGWADGYAQLSGDGFDGMIDEVRVFDGVPTDEWLGNEYAAVNDPQFQSFGTVETVGGLIDYDSFDRHVIFTVSESAVDDPSLTDMPVPVRLSRGRIAGFDATKCGERGSRLRFATADGRILPFEVEKWDASGESVVWVRLPHCRPRATFTMNWSCRTALPITPAATETWTRYAAVWHLNGLEDATGHGYVLNDHVYPDGPKPVSAAMIGGGYDFDSTKTNLLMTGSTINSPDYLTNTNVTQFTVTMWVCPSALNDRQVMMSNKPVNADGWSGFTIRSGLSGGVTQGTTKENENWNYLGSVLSIGKWTHIGARFDNQSMTLFGDGVLTANKTLAEVGAQGADGRCSIGGYATSGSYKAGSSAGFNGVVDEVRVYNGAASDAWVRMECESADEDFLTHVTDFRVRKGTTIVVR